jgi:hypothetical protein
MYKIVLTHGRRQDAVDGLTFDVDAGNAHEAKDAAVRSMMEARNGRRDHSPDGYLVYDDSGLQVAHEYIGLGDP